MTKINQKSSKENHLVYAAVHQDKESYVKAVAIHHCASIVKLIIFGVIIYFSKSEFIPILTAVAANF